MLINETIKSGGWYNVLLFRQEMKSRKVISIHRDAGAGGWMELTQQRTEL